MSTIETKIEGFSIRYAGEEDTKLILHFIRELAEYEKRLDDVVATEELLHEWLFVHHKAEVIIGEFQGEPIGFALFFHNFSTFLGRAGIYLEDLYIQPEYRGRGMGKTMLLYLTKIAVDRGCGRVDWSCLDWNTPAIDFYISLGAEDLSEWTGYRVSGDTLDELAKQFN